MRDLVALRAGLEPAVGSLGKLGLTSANPPRPSPMPRTLRGFSMEPWGAMDDASVWRKRRGKETPWLGMFTGEWLAIRARQGAKLESEETCLSTVAERAWALRDVSRVIHPSESTCHCGWSRIGSVGLMRRSAEKGGGHTLSSVATCGSVHDCPVCAMAIKGQRAEQISRGVELHRQHFGPQSLALNTYTIRHSDKHTLQELADGFQAAWYKFKNRLPKELIFQRRDRKNQNLRRIRNGEEPLPHIKSFFEEADYLGGVYGQEVTHGANGWHLHRHEVAAFARNLSDEERENFEAQARRWWAECVADAMGLEFVPTERGFSCDALHVADYISKLGLEVADVGTKTARNGSSTQWGLMYEASRGDWESVHLLGEYSCTMKGRKCIQFADKLRKLWVAFGMQPLEVDDGALVEDRTAELLLEIPDAAWSALRRTGALARLLAETDSAKVLEGLRKTVPSEAWESRAWGSGERVEFERDRRAEHTERLSIQAADGLRNPTRVEARGIARAKLREWNEAVDRATMRAREERAS